jgi:hypothetical protein
MLGLKENNHHLHYWPTSLYGLGLAVGVAIFCFGLPSLIFPIEESMINKENISLTNIQSEFNTYLWIFFGCILILILLIFTVPSGYLPELPSPQLSTIS